MEFSSLETVKIQPVLESPDHSGPDFNSELSYMFTGMVQPDLYCVLLTLKSVERNRSFHGTACFTGVSFMEGSKSPKNVLGWFGFLSVLTVKSPSLVTKALLQAPTYALDSTAYLRKGDLLSLSAC